MDYSEDELVTRLGFVENPSFTELKELLTEEGHFAADTLHEYDLSEELQLNTKAGIRNAECALCDRSYSCKNVCLVGEDQINSKSKLMVIMDAPVEDMEDVTDNFKLSKFYEIYDKAIQGSSRDEIYITYATKCTTGDTTMPNDEDVNTCMEAYLDKEIEKVKPECILTMGEPAFQKLTGKKNVLLNNGTIYEYKGVKVVGTFHPAYVQKAEGKVEYFAKDIYKAYCISKGIELEEHRTLCKITKTVEEVRELAEYISEAGEVCFDYETTGLDFQRDTETVIGFSFNHGAGWVVPIHHFDNIFNESQLSEVIDILNTYVFDNPSVIKIAHNTKFDMKFAIKTGFRFRGRFEDTMLMHHLLDENSKHGLKDVATKFFPEFKGYEDEVAKYKWEDVPLAILSPYCVADTDLTLRIYRIFVLRLLEEPELYNLYRNFTLPTMKLTNELEMTGFKVDQEYLEQAIKKTQEDMSDAQTRLRNHPVVIKFEEKTIKRKKREAIAIQEEKRDNPENSAIKVKNAEKKLREIKAGEVKLYDGINFGSHKQLGDLLFTREGFSFPLPYVHKKRGKARSTEAQYIMEFKDDSGFIDLLLEWRGYGKVLSTYLLGIKNKMGTDGRVHPSYKVHGTVTGRLSCVQPNLQNIPRGSTASIVKPMFVVEDDRVLVQVDYSQAELRIAALMANDETMLEIYANDGDIHSTTAKKVIGVSEEEWESMSKSEVKELRSKAKPVNFGFLYGQQAKSFLDFAKTQYGVIFTLEEAEKFRSNYFKLYDRLLRWHKKTIKGCENDGFVRTLFGSKRRPNIYAADEYLKRDAERESINSPVQGTGGQLTLFAAYLLKWRLDPSTKFINTVHDSLMYSVRKDILDKEIKMMKNTCENTLTEEYFGFNFHPIKMKVDIAVGNTWGNLEDIDI